MVSKIFANKKGKFFAAKQIKDRIERQLNQTLWFPRNEYPLLPNVRIEKDRTGKQESK
jgi:hypothetical protein